MIRSGYSHKKAYFMSVVPYNHKITKLLVDTSRSHVVVLLVPILTDFKSFYLILLIMKINLFILFIIYLLLVYTIVYIMIFYTTIYSLRYFTRLLFLFSSLLVIWSKLVFIYFYV